MTEREQMARWVRTWKEAGPELEAQRRADIRAADNRRALELLEDAFDHALRKESPRAESGLVEMQRWFAKGRGA